MKHYAWIIGLLVVAMLVGCAGGMPVTQMEPVMIEGAETGDETAELPPAGPVNNAILVDGELVSAYPALKLAFSGNASGELLALHVQVGQRVQAGDLIATLDDAELRKAVADAQLALDRAREDLAQAQQDAEETYQKAVRDADKKYDRELEDAQDQYDRELQEAQKALESAQLALRKARMQPPSTALQEAQVNLDRAREAEADAADEYKRALDRPWEPQEIRDSLYKQWQRTIVDRQLAELRYQDAQTSMDVYALDLVAQEKGVERAKADLDKVEMAEVEKDEVEREDNFTTYERAIADAEEQLTKAQEHLPDAALYAPWGGLVISIDTSVGAVVSAGTPVVTLLNVDDLYFITDNLSERHVAQIEPGQKAHITLRTYPDAVVEGTVEVVIPVTERQGDVDARFAAYIRVQESDFTLLPGMSGRVEIAAQ